MAVMVDDSESENEDVEIEDVEIEDLSKVTFRNHAKGHGFGLEQDQVQPTPKLQTSIWDHKNHSQDSWMNIFSMKNNWLFSMKEN